MMAPDATWSGRWGAGSREKDAGPSLGLAGTLPGKGGFPLRPQQVDVGRGWRGVSPGPRAGTEPAPPTSHLPGRRVPGRPVKQAAEGCSLQFSKPVPSGDVQERKANFLARRRWGADTQPTRMETARPRLSSEGSNACENVRLSPRPGSGSRTIALLQRTGTPGRRAARGASGRWPWRQLVPRTGVDV